MPQAIGVERLGLTREEAEQFLAAWRPLAARMPAVCTLHPGRAGLDFGHHLLDWEAELLRQVFDHFKTNTDVCVLLTQLIRESENADSEDFKRRW